ncbi:DEAD/DEAH box helicase [Pedobacter sp. KLB.chiD]|uniref:DEAD/DEAH box helicase n=1 Tax=Pedobacter sp. KLB.chiD TaxID=3387402 RepID=UPI00399B555B
MNNELIDSKLKRLDADTTIQNYFAQANARYILLNTEENRENFPSYTINDDQLNLLALQYLHLGCSYAENEALVNASIPLEKGASLLEVIHGAKANRKTVSDYYGLIASLAYYVAFEYSKAFILIKKFEATTIIASMLGLFLQRNFTQLNEQLYSILMDSEYLDDRIAENSEEEGNQKIYEITIARALNGFIQFYISGNQQALEDARFLLRNLKEIAELEEDAGIWWVIRLLLLISNGFNEASVWHVLPKYFNIENIQVKNYLRSLVYLQPRGHYELFITQRAALDQVINSEFGCVVSIPTSSGKTRIAEIAILHSIQSNPDGKILYVAPFRSLAFEIENSLEKVFQSSGIVVSHLYGGSLFSKLDELNIMEAQVIIATPEKAKALFRANTDIINDVTLTILDEGHLLGPDKRLVMNEIFYEELRFYMQRNWGRFLLLSAVLPNAQDLAKWLIDNDEAIFKNSWRPSDERLGILEWRNNNVSLNWESQDHERSSFNPYFITSEEVSRYKYRGEEKIKYFPGDKNEAVATTAYKLRTFGPLLIFVGLKDSVFVMAEAYLKAMNGYGAADHQWKNKSLWRIFQLSCTETYGPDNKWLQFAKMGILCHNAALHSDVRLPLERIMREEKPLVIISTSTLGQGVNLGVSTVIFSTLYQAGDPVRARDFWNIAGRAGRAFVDHEGKILVAIDTNNKSQKSRLNSFNSVRENYFSKEKIDYAESGILSLISALKSYADSIDVDFSLLIELITENNISAIGEKADAIDEILDWVDDTLLSLLLIHNSEGDISISWVEDFFSKSLAYIQISSNKNISHDEFLDFIKARTIGIVAKVSKDRNKWRSIVGSGIPLNSDLIIEDNIDELISNVDEYLLTEGTFENLLDLLESIETTIEGLPVLNEKGQYLKYPNVAQVRRLWLGGDDAYKIFQIERGAEIVTGVYSFSLPWILNGIAKKFKSRDLDTQATILEELSLFVEVGLPSIIKVKIYQAGIRSRSAANELGNFCMEFSGNEPISTIKRILIANTDSYSLFVSEATEEWLAILRKASTQDRLKIKRVSNFEFGKIHEKTDVLIAQIINGKKFLISPDVGFVYQGWGSIDFMPAVNKSGIIFRYDESDNLWFMESLNPYIEIIDDD